MRVASTLSASAIIGILAAAVVSVGCGGQHPRPPSPLPGPSAGPAVTANPGSTSTVVTASPNTAAPGVAFRVTVELRSALGVRLPLTEPVSAAIVNSPVLLGGTTTVTAVGGTATFSDLM